MHYENKQVMYRGLPETSQFCTGNATVLTAIEAGEETNRLSSRSEGVRIASDEIRGNRQVPGFASCKDAVNLPFLFDEVHAIALDSMASNLLSARKNGTVTGRLLVSKLLSWS